MRRSLTTSQRLVSVACLALLITAGCAAEEDPMDVPPGPAAPSTPPVPGTPSAPGVPADPDAPLEVPAGAIDVALLPTEEIAAQIEVAIADAAERAGVDPATVAVARSLRVTWSDGSLGCPEEDMMYTQALVDGYLITLEVDGSRIDYHGAIGDDPFPCERG
jgi:PBP1b-binding outer membrane lipoprotein LpoB